MSRYAIGESVRLIYTPSATAIRDGIDSSIKANVFERSDGKKALAVDAISSDTPLTPNSNNSKTVTTANTRVRLIVVSTTCSLVRVIADKDNTGKIYLGYANVSNDNFDFVLEAEDGEYILTDNLNKVYIDSDTDGQKIYFTYFT